MSVGAIYELETDTGPMDRILEDGPPTQAQLQSTFGGIERFEGTPSPTTLTPISVLLVLLVLVVALVLFIRTRPQKPKESKEAPDQ